MGSFRRTKTQRKFRPFAKNLTNGSIAWILWILWNIIVLKQQFLTFFYRLVPKWTLESVVNTPFIYHNHQGMLWEKVWFISVCMKYYIHIEKYTFELNQLGSVAGPVIQANGRLSFEDYLRSGGLLYCVSQ